MNGNNGMEVNAVVVEKKVVLINPEEVILNSYNNWKSTIEDLKTVSNLHVIATEPLNQLYHWGGFSDFDPRGKDNPTIIRPLNYQEIEIHTSFLAVLNVVKELR